MSGIYIHIPFCRKACHYCNFHFSTSLQSLSRMTDAICREARLQSGYLTGEVETVYFGGGTPSLLEASQIQKILTALASVFTLSPQAEITLETNPDDISAERLEEWKRAGINRLSIGVQSFFEEHLQWMNRAHNALQAQRSITLAQEHGFSNITIDLIYGSPGLTDDQWRQNVLLALQSGVPHISCYALTVEPRTALAKMVQAHQAADTDPDRQADQFRMLMQWLGEAGFEHYEISNFAKPGFRSRHNSSYWQGRPYIGLGPSAHSFNGAERQWNMANNALYMQAIEKDEIPFEKEILTPAQQFNEYVMTALRTSEGISLEKISSGWTENLPALMDATQKHIQAGHLTADGERLLLTEKGKFLADGIAADLFC
jgi:oxygen-independent coproporphyrinogen-3 oxidase